ncbi:MAG: hypothetical protein ABI689_18455 [Thermoanaerobaculia bacterium]
MTRISTGFAILGAFALTAGIVAQTPAPAPAPAPAPHATMMHDGHDATMMQECQAMKAKKQAMDAKLSAMDASLDKLVATMNAAATDKAPDAMEKPMAAVLNELVTQRKAMHSMMSEMQPEMMAHMMKHMDMHGEGGGMKGMSGCPMMTMDAPAAKPVKN